MSLIQTFVCHKTWEALEKVNSHDNSRFCKDCGKMVHNLQHIDEEIPENLRNTSFCAVIPISRLQNRPTIPNALAISFSLGALLLPTQEGFAQTKPIENNKNLIDISDTLNRRLFITGKLIDTRAGAGLAFAEIILTNHSGVVIGQCTSHKDGEYIIPVDSLFLDSLLTLSCRVIGYLPININHIKMRDVLSKMQKIEINASALPFNGSRISMGAIVSSVKMVRDPLIEDPTRPNTKTYNREQIRRMPK